MLLFLIILIILLRPRRGFGMFHRMPMNHRRMWDFGPPPPRGHDMFGSPGFHGPHGHGGPHGGHGPHGPHGMF